MSGRALLYGANGFTGRNTAERLASMGVEVVLAGRNSDSVRKVAESLGLDWISLHLGSTQHLELTLREFDVVLNAAGPFGETARPMIKACLRTGVHYLDFAGEWHVFQDAMSFDHAARDASIMIMPGVGLTIVATDCLMALAIEKWPDLVRFRLGVSKPSVASRGSMISAAQLISSNVIIRKSGDLVSVPAGHLTHAFDFGEGLSECVAMSWADVVTGQSTTGVDDIEVYMEIDWPQRVSYRSSGMLMEITGEEAWRKITGALVKAWPEGPSEQRRRDGGLVMVIEGLDPWRRPRRLKMRTLDGYSVSVATAAAAVDQVLRGNWASGFQTPARVFGADFILGLGCASLETAAPSSKGAAM